MALLSDSERGKKLDIRLIERNINRKITTREEVDREIAALPDDSENAEWVNLESLMSQPDSDAEEYGQS